MPWHDFLCEACGALREDVVETDGTEVAACSECGGHMVKVPAAPSFRVTGFNAKNSYGVKE